MAEMKDGMSASKSAADEVPAEGVCAEETSGDGVPPRLKYVFLLSLLFFVAAYAWFEYARSHQSWQKWQEKYFQAQADQVAARLTQTSDPAAKADLEKTILDLKQKNPEIKALTLPNGKQELCLTCHLGIEEISPSHPIDSFGCTVCHGGNAMSLNKGEAHRGMYGGGHPGSLKVSRLSCGASDGPVKCHSGNEREADDEVDLVPTSLMANKGGELSMVRYMFGLDLAPRISVNPGQAAAEVPTPFGGKAQETALTTNCLEACHQDGGQILPSGTSAQGCESCHVLSNAAHTYQGEDVTMTGNQGGRGQMHRLTTQIPYTQCNQCHNVGLSDLYTMSFKPRSDLGEVAAWPQEKADDYSARLRNVYQPGMVFTSCEVKLDCIDCHTRQEVMGDGHLYASEYDALKLQCLDCHGTQTEKPKAWTISSLDDLAFEEKLNPAFPALNLGDQILQTRTGEELPWVRFENNHLVLYRKTDGQKYEIPLVSGSACRQEPDKQTSNDCHKCHDVSGNLHPSP